jgi:hypothetical protein
MILVTDTAPGPSNTGAHLYALHPTTGKQLWNYSLTDSSLNWWGSIGLVPAWDSSTNGAIYVTVGKGIVAINPVTGKSVGMWEGSGDPIVSSPVVINSYEDTASAVILHTTLGTVRRLSISGNVLMNSAYP